MSVGDNPAFSRAEGETTYAEDGMTYRQWLIGQALAGLNANPSMNDMTSEWQAARAVQSADFIIERLDGLDEDSP